MSALRVTSAGLHKLKVLLSPTQDPMIPNLKIHHWQTPECGQDIRRESGASLKGKMTPDLHGLSDGLSETSFTYWNVSQRFNEMKKNVSIHLNFFNNSNFFS